MRLTCFRQKGVDGVVWWMSVAAKLASGVAPRSRRADVYSRLDLTVDGAAGRGVPGRRSEVYATGRVSWLQFLRFCWPSLADWSWVGKAGFGFLVTTRSVATILVGLLATPLAPIARTRQRCGRGEHDAGGEKVGRR